VEWHQVASALLVHQVAAMRYDCLLPGLLAEVVEQTRVVRQDDPSADRVGGPVGVDQLARREDHWLDGEGDPHPQ